MNSSFRKSIKKIQRKSLNTKAIEKMVHEQENVGVVDLTEKKIGDDGVKMLGMILPNTCHTLELFGNEITDDGVSDLIDLLVLKSNVRTVKLEWNEISHRGAQLLAEFLKENNTVEKLDLYGCRVKDTGARSLAVALSSNTTLTYLGLFNCGINDDGATHLARHLTNNETLQYLNLDNNNIDDDLVDYCHACTARNLGEDDVEFPDIHDFFADYPDSKYPDPEKSSRKPEAARSNSKFEIDTPYTTPIQEDKIRLKGYESSPDPDYMMAHLQALIEEKQALLSHIAELYSQLKVTSD